MIGLENLPRLAEFVRRWAGAEEIVPPGVIAQVDRPEWQWLYQARLWSSGVITVAANVGNVSEIEMFNPAQRDSTLIVVITMVKVINQLAGVAYTLTLNGGAGAVPAIGVPRDSRILGGTQAVSRISNGSVGVSGLFLDRITGVLGADKTFDVLPVILAPNNRLNVWNGTQNSPITAVFAGYEYNGRAEELAP